jgi:uncharacterized iron-regulated protein
MVLLAGVSTVMTPLATNAAECVSISKPMTVGTVLARSAQRSPALACVSDRSEMVARLRDVLASGGIVLLGEVHDNADHHEQRAKLLQEITAEGVGQRPRPGLVFEHIRADQAAGIEAFKDFDLRAARKGNVGDLFRFLDWKSSGWPDQEIFAPLFSAVLGTRLAILPGHPPRAAVRDVARNGLTALETTESKRLNLDAALPEPFQDALLGELEGSHCGMMPKSAFRNMAMAQRYRDAHMADALVLATEMNGSAILFAGNGHVRTDRGVPYYWRERKDKPVAAVMLVEHEAGNIDIPRAPDGTWAADYVILTARAKRTDPCEEMRAKGGQKK